MMYPRSLPESAASVTAGASALPGGPAYGLYVGGTGDLTVTTRRGESVTFAAVPAGSFLPIIVTHVTAMTATAVLALR